MILNRQRAVRVKLSRLRLFEQRLRRTLKLGRQSFNVCLVDDPAIAGYNARYRGKSRATDVLLAQGCAPEVYVCATHPVFAGPAFDRLSRPEIREVIVTNTIPIHADRQPAKITVLSAAPLLAEAIRRIHLNQSVSLLFT